jgi:ABC-type transport system substrate-binding protein
MLVLGGGLLTAAFAHEGATGATAKVRQGGTFRIASSEREAAIDPALYNAVVTSMTGRAACAHLMNYPDKNSPIGLRVVPEAASRYTASRDGKTYSFVIRRGLRFSNGASVTAQSFVRAFVRALANQDSYGAYYAGDVVGAKTAGEGERPRGVVAQGKRLTVRLTRPAPDFPARMALFPFCAVPADLPIDPEGVAAPLHSAGPYYVAEFVRGRRIVLSRNRYYRGPRPHHVDRIVVDLQAAGSLDAIERVKRGVADYASFTDRRGYEESANLARLYGRNKSRFWLQPGLNFQGFFLNTRRGIFRNNLPLRRAVNFAIDRPALRDTYGRVTGGPHDQYMPPSVPGFRDSHIYPVNGPNVRKARSLVRGHLRGGKAVLYTPDDTVSIAQAQIVKRNLAVIGLEVEVRASPSGVHFRRLFERGEPWDLGSFGWAGDYPDPHEYLNVLFGPGGAFNPGFDASWFNRALARAGRMKGAARYRAYGDLDIRLAQKAAPFLTFMYGIEPTFVSSRVDPRCIVRRPELDLAAVCLKR